MPRASTFPVTIHFENHSFKKTVLVSTQSFLFSIFERVIVAYSANKQFFTIMNNNRTQMKPTFMSAYKMTSMTVMLPLFHIHPQNFMGGRHRTTRPHAVIARRRVPGLHRLH